MAKSKHAAKIALYFSVVTTFLPVADDEVGASRILGESIDYTSPKVLPA